MAQNETHGLPISFIDVLTSDGRAAILNTNYYNGCEAVVPQPLTVGETDYYVQHYVFPVQFILGVAGNCINLLVLLGSGMKNPVSHHNFVHLINLILGKHSAFGHGVC